MEMVITRYLQVSERCRGCEFEPHLEYIFYDIYVDKLFVYSYNNA